MPSIIFRLIALISTAALGSSGALNDEDLLERADDAFTERTRLQKEHNQEFKTAVWDKLSDLSSDERTRAVVLWMLSLEKYKPDSPRTTQALSYAIFDDPRLAENETEFRRMLQNEDDPRRFYLISSIASIAVQRFGYDFVACRARMLLRDGAVAKPEGELNPTYIHDVSIPTYSAIVYNLRQLGADFEEADEALPHEEKVDHLVRWLRENWPGCEKLGLWTAGSSPTERSRKAGAQAPIERRRMPEAEATGDVDELPSSRWALWIAGGVLAAALAIFFVGLKRNR